MKFLLCNFTDIQRFGVRRSVQEHCYSKRGGKFSKIFKWRCIGTGQQSAWACHACRQAGRRVAGRGDYPPAVTRSINSVWQSYHFDIQYVTGNVIGRDTTQRSIVSKHDYGEVIVWLIFCITTLELLWTISKLFWLFRPSRLFKISKHKNLIKIRQGSTILIILQHIFQITLTTR